MKLDGENIITRVAAKRFLMRAFSLYDCYCVERVPRLSFSRLNWTLIELFQPWVDIAVQEVCEAILYLRCVQAPRRVFRDPHGSAARRLIGSSAMTDLLYLCPNSNTVYEVVHHQVRAAEEPRCEH